MHFQNISCSNAGKAGIGLTSMDGSNISGISFSNIRLAGITEPIHMYVAARAVTASCLALPLQNHDSCMIAQWQRRPPPYVVGSIENISFVNITATNVTGRPPSFARDTNFTATMDGQGISENASTVHPISGVRFENLSIHYAGGGGTTEDAVECAEPYHDPNDGGPRVMGVRPSWGLFLRHLRDSTFNDIRLGFAHNDDRPSVLITDCHNVTFSAGIELQRGTQAVYDIALRNSSAVAVVDPDGDVRTCAYASCLGSTLPAATASHHPPCPWVC